MSCVVQVFSVRLWVMRVFHEKVLNFCRSQKTKSSATVAWRRCGLAWAPGPAPQTRNSPCIKVLNDLYVCTFTYTCHIV